MDVGPACSGAVVRGLPFALARAPSANACAIAGWPNSRTTLTTNSASWAVVRAVASASEARKCRMPSVSSRAVKASGVPRRSVAELLHDQVAEYGRGYLAEVARVDLVADLFDDLVDLLGPHRPLVAGFLQAAADLVGVERLTRLVLFDDLERRVHELLGGPRL